MLPAVPVTGNCSATVGRILIELKGNKAMLIFVSVSNSRPSWAATYLNCYSTNRRWLAEFIWGLFCLFVWFILRPALTWGHAGSICDGFLRHQVRNRCIMISSSPHCPHLPPPQFSSRASPLLGRSGCLSDRRSVDCGVSEHVLRGWIDCDG